MYIAVGVFKDVAIGVFKDVVIGVVKDFAVGVVEDVAIGLVKDLSIVNVLGVIFGRVVVELSLAKLKALVYLHALV